VRARFDEDLGLLVQRELTRAHGILGGEILAALGPCLSAAARNLGATREDFVPWRGAVSPLGTDLRDLGRWRAVAAVLLTGGGKIRKRVDKNLGFPTGSECATWPRFWCLRRRSWTLSFGSKGPWIFPPSR
jgi:hypothetical protein